MHRNSSTVPQAAVPTKPPPSSTYRQAPSCSATPPQTDHWPGQSRTDRFGSGATAQQVLDGCEQHQAWNTPAQSKPPPQPTVVTAKHPPANTCADALERANAIKRKREDALARRAAKRAVTPSCTAGNSVTFTSPQTAAHPQPARSNPECINATLQMGTSNSNNRQQQVNSTAIMTMF